MIKLVYRANNSGGDWWLTDEDWQKLESAGWEVEWAHKSEHLSAFVREGRYLGALAKEATKHFETADEGVREWRELTGQDPWAEGCNCCGQPHRFSFDGADGKTHYAEIETTSSFAGWK